MLSQTLPDISARPYIHLPAGHRLGGKYVVLRLLGEGGMGAVYLAEDIVLQRRVAIKTISPEADETTRSRFLREAQIAANLQGDSIVRIHDFGEDEASGAPYFVMDAYLLSETEIGHVSRDILGCPPPIVVRGPTPDGLYPLTLQNVLEGDRALGEVAAARLGLAVLDSLTVLHAASPPIIHRDLKPSNLLFTPSGRLLLTDFGISRPERAASGSLPTPTLGGNPLGTPSYAAPEQRNGDELTIAADYYSLGIVLYRMLTGGLPPSASATLPTDVAVRNARAWNGLLAGLLARDPAVRLTDREAIRRILVLIASRPRPVPYRIAAAAVLALVALVVVMLSKNSDVRRGDVKDDDGFSAVSDIAPSSTNAVAGPFMPLQKLRAELKLDGEVDWEKVGAEALASLPSNMVEIAVFPKSAKPLNPEFLMCRYEVTQALWREIMGNNPSRIEGPALPVVGVLWEECKTFVARLNERPEVVASGLVYRLPSADEWLYCALGGECEKQGIQYKYRHGRHADGTAATETTISRMEWYRSNSGGLPHPIGQREPNYFGLYDMVGNAAEWTASTSEDKTTAYVGGRSFENFALEIAKHSGLYFPVDRRDWTIGTRLCAERCTSGRDAPMARPRTFRGNVPTDCAKSDVEKDP